MFKFNYQGILISSMSKRLLDKICKYHFEYFLGGNESSVTYFLYGGIKRCNVLPDSNIWMLHRVQEMHGLVWDMGQP